MATDGEANFSTYSGAQLLQALDSIDRQRFPRNFELLRREIGIRPAPGPSLVSGGEVAEFVRLRPEERKLLLRNCMTKVFWLQLQYWLYGVLLGLLALGLVSLLVHMSGASWSAPIVSLLLLVIMVAMSFAAYWAYTKWLLHEPIGEFAFRLLRVRRDGN